MNKEKTDQRTILVMATTFPRWEEDTVPQFVYELSKEIQKHGFKVIVLAPHHDGAERKETMSGLTVHRYPYFLPKKYQELCYDGGIIESIKNNPLTSLQIPLLVSSLLTHTMMLLYREDVDILHSHWLVPNGLIAAAVSQITDTPHLMTLHAGGVLGLQKIPFHREISTFVYRRSDAIAPVSSHICDNFIGLLNENVDRRDDRFQIQPMGAHTQDYEGYNEQKIREERDLENKTIGLFVGRLAEKKGIEYLIRATEELKFSAEDFELVIVGTGPLKDEIQDQMKASKARDLIKLTGWISEDELNGLYVASDFVIVPSIEAESGDTEGMPTVIAEAFASGNPVIASDVGGISDVVIDQENGYLVTEKNVGELANKIEDLISDTDLQKVMSRNAFKTAAELDWETCGKNYSDILYNISYQPIANNTGDIT